MNKTVLTLLFLFGALIGGFFYLDKNYFFEINACIGTGNGWSYEENTCKTEEDIKKCSEENGIWIKEENICDIGDIIK